MLYADYKGSGQPAQKTQNKIRPLIPLDTSKWELKEAIEHMRFLVLADLLSTLKRTRNCVYETL